jgi:hypothetical protein
MEESKFDSLRIGSIISDAHYPLYGLGTVIEKLENNVIVKFGGPNHKPKFNYCRFIVEKFLTVIK